MKTKQQKREEALERNEKWESLSTKEKITRLKSRQGESKKQINKLEKQLTSK